MSPQACRSRLAGQLRSRQVAHAGVILDRFVPFASGDETPAAERQKARDELRQAATLAMAQCASVYEAAFERRRRWAETRCAARMATHFRMQTPEHQRLVVGLGRQSAMETGLTLHHTYGTPLIPGSALKGLAAHYCAAVHGGDGYAILFGDAASAGYFTFHDAWLAPDSLRTALLADVMTTHHQLYYGRKTYENDGPIPPTDFDDPIPIDFFSLRGTFHFVVSCDDPSDHAWQWLGAARGLVIEALGEWGAGGKTSSGYGRLIPADAPGTAES